MTEELPRASIELPKRFLRVEHYVDSAFKDGVGTDFSVCATWAKDHDENAFLLDLWRKRLEFPELLAALIETVRRRRAPLVIEDKASGIPAIQVLKRLRVPVIAHKIGNVSKEARADAVTGWVESGNVYLPLPQDAQWVEAFIDEHAAFPAGVHDDMVDTTSMALMRLMGKGKLPLPSEYRMGLNGEAKAPNWNPFGGEQKKLAEIARELLPRRGERINLKDLKEKDWQSWV